MKPFRAAMAHQRVLVFILVLTLVPLAKAEEHPITVEAWKTSGPTPAVVPVNVNTTAGLTASVTPTGVSKEALANGVTWQWEVIQKTPTDPFGTNPVCVADIAHASSTSPIATLTARGDGAPAAAVWTGTCKATAMYSDGEDVWRGSGTVEVEFTAVALWLLYYQSGAEWVSINDAEPFYVMKGTSVTFKARKWPDAAIWPDGKPAWGGSSGTTGTGETKPVTFNTRSNHLTDYKTVTSECGNTVTLNVVVYELTPTLEPVADFDRRSYDRLGIMELADLGFAAVPDVTAAQAGGLNWVHSGVGVVATGQYLAGPTAGVATLKLRVQSGPSAGRDSSSLSLTIVAPNGGICVQKNGVFHRQDRLAIGIMTDFFLTPKDVSFSGITFIEGYCEAQTTGWFTYYGYEGSAHDPVQNEWEWCSVAIPEDALSGSRVVFPGPTFDTAEFDEHEPGVGDYWDGIFFWEIPWLYSTDNGQTEHEIMLMLQAFAVYDDWLTAALKGYGEGAPYGQAFIDDPDSDY